MAAPRRSPARRHPRSPARRPVPAEEIEDAALAEGDRLRFGPTRPRRRSSRRGRTTPKHAAVAMPPHAAVRHRRHAAGAVSTAPLTAPHDAPPSQSSSASSARHGAKPSPCSRRWNAGANTWRETSRRSGGGSQAGGDLPLVAASVVVVRRERGVHGRAWATRARACDVRKVRDTEPGRSNPGELRQPARDSSGSRTTATPAWDSPNPQPATREQPTASRTSAHGQWSVPQ